MKILVTGGCGYIGSHTVVELLNEGYEVVVVDNLSNSSENVIDRIQKITEKDVKFYKGDLCNKDVLKEIFKEHKIDAVIHFAGYKAVGESVANPLKYYRNNIDSTLTLCEVMNEFDCKKLVFSSSATVYGNPKELPIKEDFPLHTTNPYGSTKLYIEEILKDLYQSDPSWSIALLRYFNPVGAHESGLLFENPKGIPNNLMPYIVRVACGKLKELSIFGNDYNTKDGTGVRDYLHVVDLAKGHIKAIQSVFQTNEIEVYNLGTGKGVSVLEMVETFKKVNQVDVPYKFAPRRDGDIDACYADVHHAKEKLGWEANLTLEDMCKSSYQSIKNHRDE